MCALKWHKVPLPLHQLNETVMNTTDTLSRLSAMFASDETFMAMADLVDELGLEIKDITMA